MRYALRRKSGLVALEENIISERDSDEGPAEGNLEDQGLRVLIEGQQSENIDEVRTPEGAHHIDDPPRSSFSYPTPIRELHE